MAMPGAAPDRGAETAEGTAVASARPQGTALVTENLNGEAVAAAGTDRGARPVAASAGIAMTGAAAACIARTRADATGGPTEPSPFLTEIPENLKTTTDNADMSAGPLGPERPVFAV